MRTPKSPAEFGFNRYDQQRLRKALKQVNDKRSFRRLQAVLLVAQGRTVNEAASITDVSLQTIYNWLDPYLKSHQVESLYDRERAGRPLVAKTITDARVLRELQRNPLRLGYGTTVWTVALLANHLTKRYGCSISPRTLRRRMKHIGLRCKRPRFFYSEKDPHRAQKKGPLSAH